jgi:hypothetical protein
MIIFKIFLNILQHSRSWSDLAENPIEITFLCQPEASNQQNTEKVYISALKALILRYPLDDNLEKY